MAEINHATAAATSYQMGDHPGPQWQKPCHTYTCCQPTVLNATPTIVNGHSCRALNF